uniref:Uncharacterized protein n=1 Tax=Lygus hesperus TaxID=30085 RepID=A0A0K8SDD0_LYGHE
MKNAEKITTKQDEAVGKDAASTAMQLLNGFQENVCNINCILVPLLAAVITVFIWKNWVKKLDVAGGKENPERTSAKDKEGVAENDESDSSEAEDVSEEDLPWLLQKPPGGTSMTDEKKKNRTDEKHSECSGSDKSLESVRMMKKVQGVEIPLCQEASR